ncbi:MAG: hypothetical protein ABIN37_09250 [Burkholderiaceae bacterium]
MMDALWLWLTLALLVFWMVGAHNRLVRLRAQVRSAFQAVDQCYSQYLGLLDTHMPLTAYEFLAPARAGLRGAVVQFDNSLRATRREVLDAAALAGLRAAHITLQVWWERLLEAPAPATNDMAQPWKDGWTHAARRAGDAVVRFNEAAARHNAAIGQFPALLLARLFGFRAVGML